MQPRPLGRLLLATRALPPRAAAFQVRAMLRAALLGDDWALRSSTRPKDVAELVRLARGRRSAVELGTATGWTAGALLLAERERRPRRGGARLAAASGAGGAHLLHDYGNPAYPGVAEAVAELALDGRSHAWMFLAET